MTDQEKAALLQFLGVTHAQAKQTDQMIVGQSQFLKPISNTISQTFEQVLKTPTFANNDYRQQPVYQEPVQQAPVYQEPVYQEPVVDAQLQFQFNEPSPQPVNSDEIVQQLKEINLNLVKIAAILTESNVKTKTKNTIKG